MTTLFLFILPFIGYASNVQTSTCNNSANVSNLINQKLILLSNKLNLIAKSIGKSVKTQPVIKVQNASFREVAFEIDNMQLKINQLVYETTGAYSKLSNYDKNTLSPCDVESQVNDSIELLKPVETKLQIKTTSQILKTQNNINASNIFNKVLEINNFLNVLLYQKTMPGDVYSQITLIIAYVDEILKHYQLNSQYKENKSIFKNKTPFDVYQKLLMSFEILQNIFHHSNLNILSISVHKKLTNIQPNDVLSLAKIILAETEYLSSLLPYSFNFKNYYYGYKTPSDVYTKVIELNQKLTILNQFSQTSPGMVF